MLDQKRSKILLGGYYVSVTGLCVVVPKPGFA